MKAIHYDAEGDILTITFNEAGLQTHTGVELSDNLILYFNPDTKQPLKLIIISYQALLHASATTPLLLDGLTEAPAKTQATVQSILERAPLTAILQLEKIGSSTFAGYLHGVFTPDALLMVTAS